MHLNTPQILLICFFAPGLLISLFKHGENQSKGEYSFYLTLSRTLIIGILLYWGGFFG